MPPKNLNSFLQALVRKGLDVTYNHQTLLGSPQEFPKRTSWGNFPRKVFPRDAQVQAQMVSLVARLKPILTFKA